MAAHSVLTINLRDDDPEGPTKKAEQRVIAFFRERTGPADQNFRVIPVKRAKRARAGTHRAACMMGPGSRRARPG